VNVTGVVGAVEGAAITDAESGKTSMEIAKNMLNIFQVFLLFIVISSFLVLHVFYVFSEYKRFELFLCQYIGCLSPLSGT
jgi:hypothetical protein